MSNNADPEPNTNTQELCQDMIVQAAARILSRHHHPDWRPSTDDLDAWGHGYITGHRQGYADGGGR